MVGAIHRQQRLAALSIAASVSSAEKTAMTRSENSRSRDTMRCDGTCLSPVSHLSYHEEEENYLLRGPANQLQPSAVLCQEVHVGEPAHRQRPQVNERRQRPPQLQPLRANAEHGGTT